MAAQPATMSEGLQRVLQDLSSTMSTPDADIQFLTQLQGVIIGRMRAGSSAAHPGQPPGGAVGGGMPPGAGPGGPPPGPPGGGQMAGPPTPNGVTPLSPQPDPDELRRMIAGAAGAGGQ